MPTQTGNPCIAIQPASTADCLLTVVIDLLGFGVVLPLLARYAERLEANELTIGLLTASFSAMQFVLAPLWGRLSDRIGRRPVLIVGLAGSVVFYALFGYASLIESLSLLFVARSGPGSRARRSRPAAGLHCRHDPSGTPGGRDGAHRSGVWNRLYIRAALGSRCHFLGWAFAHARLDRIGLSAISLVLALVMLPESIKPDGRLSKWSWLGIENFQSVRAMPAVSELILISFVTVFAFANFESTLSLLTSAVTG